MGRERWVLVMIMVLSSVFGFASVQDAEGGNHFVPIWDGENGTGHMNIYVVGAMLDGSLLDIGDEIGICSGDICVGTGKLSRSIDVDNFESYVSVIVSMDDGTQNGFVPGDTIVYRFWDVSEQEELAFSEVVYRSDLDTWTVDGKFLSGASAFVELSAERMRVQEIDLKSGWNLVSMNVAPENKDMMDVMSQLIEDDLLVKVKDQSGKTLERWLQSMDWQNQMEDLANDRGYEIFVNAECVLQVNGYPVELPMIIELVEGWNVIAFPYGEMVDGLSVVQSLIDDGALVKVQDEAGNSIEYWNDEDGWVNNIGVFEPGKGYAVKVKTNVDLIIGSSYFKSQKLSTVVVPLDHFVPEFEGNGTGHMNIYVAGAMLDGALLDVGDEIGVWSGDVCVGAVKLARSVDVNNIDSYASLVVSMEDGLLNGFVSGDTIVYRFWDVSEQKERVFSEAAYRNDLDTWSVDGRFLSGASAFVELSAESMRVQEIELKSGWNLVSVNLVPENKDMKDVMSQLIEDDLLIKVQDQSGKTLESWDQFGGWVNGVGDLSNDQGYEVYVSADCVLEVKGYSVELPMEIELVEGWNTIAFPYGEVVGGLGVVQSLIDEGVLVKVQDEAGNAIEYWNEEEGWVNNVGVFEPGKGYAVKVNADAVLTIGNSYLKSQRMSSIVLQPVHFLPSYQGNGAGHMNINVVSFAGLGLEIGDEIGAFDGDVCVGVVKLNAENIEDGVVSLSASRAGGGEDGYVDGHVVQLRVWSERSDVELPIGLDVVSGELVYERNESVFVNLMNATNTELLGMSSKLSVYPNPASVDLNVRIPDRFLKGPCSVNLINISGRIVDSRSIFLSQEIFDVRSFPSGAYFVHLQNGDERAVAKFIISK